MVIEKLAPNFEAKVDITGALKLVVYAATPALVAGILGIIPQLMFVALIGAIYSIYLFWIGVQPITNVPDARKVGFVVVSAIAVFLVAIVISLIAFRFAPPPPSTLSEEDRQRIKDSMEMLQRLMPKGN